jgi:serine/threonine protein phosphatase 1
MRWIIGDIHGMLRPLEALVRAVERIDSQRQLLFVGDYVNRGPDSNGVIELLLSLKNAHFVRGNHDDILDMVLHGSSYVTHPSAPDPVSAFCWFMEHGLAETFTSYGIDYAELEFIRHRPTPDLIRRVGESVPARHRTFIRRLPPVIEHEDLFVAHGVWGADEPDTSLAQALASGPMLRNELLWGRFGPEIGRKKRWKRTGYFGHTPVQALPANLRNHDPTPVRGPNMMMVDTGAAVSPDGRLTAVCAENGAVVQAERNGTLVP